MPLNVLLVEDNPGEARLTLETFRDANRGVRVHVVSDGVEAMAFLRREGAHAQAPRPALILLDLNLPKMGGREILTQIKYDKNFRMIPTVILTSSDAETDIRYCYEHYANCYFRKPTQWDAFGKLVKCINDLWLGLAVLPDNK